MCLTRKLQFPPDSRPPSSNFSSPFPPVISTNRSLRLARNRRTVHLFKLSEELLLIILEFAGLVSLSIHEDISVAHAVTRAKSLASLMVVCTRLHRLIMGYFRFWTVVPFIANGPRSNPRAFKFILAQYTSKDIHLVLDCGGAIGARDSLRMLLRCMETEWKRVRCISIRDSALPQEKNTVKLLFSSMPFRTMTQVDTFRFECGHTATSIPHFPHLPHLASFTIKAPSFYVQRNMDVSLGFPSSLITLSHLRVDVPIPLSVLTDFISRCHSLKSFHWFVPGNSRQLTEEIWTRPTVLSNLETLDVMHPQHFPVLDAPRLVRATFDVHMYIPRLHAYPGLYGPVPHMPNLRHMTVCVCTINGTALEQLLGTCPVLESLTLRVVTSASPLKDALDAVRRRAGPLIRHLHIGIIPRDDWTSRAKMISFSTSLRALLSAVPHLMLECKVFYHDCPSWLHNISLEFTSTMSLLHVNESEANHDHRDWCPRRSPS
jgi:hypothetical protein